MNIFLKIHHTLILKVNFKIDNGKNKNPEVNKIFLLDFESVLFFSSTVFDKLNSKKNFEH